MKFRIKEVTIPLKTGERTFFYPQTEESKDSVIGRLWWKKKIVKLEWKCFYKQRDSYVFDSPSFISEPIFFESIDDAKRFIDEYKNYLTDCAIRFYSQIGAGYDDERLTKIHEIK